MLRGIGAAAKRVGGWGKVLEEGGAVGLGEGDEGESVDDEACDPLSFAEEAGGNIALLAAAQPNSA
eukprot:2633956-Rhodomonas_salina.3